MEVLSQGLEVPLEVQCSVRISRLEVLDTKSVKMITYSSKSGSGTSLTVFPASKRSIPGLSSD